MLVESTGVSGGQKLKNRMMVTYTIANRFTTGPTMPGMRHGPQVSSKPGVLVMEESVIRGLRIPPVVRRQSRSPMTRRYDADRPATQIETMLLKAVDEPRMIKDRRVEIMVVATMVVTGIDVRGLTCEE